MTAKQVPFHIKAGLPFAKTIIATLPSGRAWWTLDNQFEVLAQIRESDDYSSPLILDIQNYITKSLATNTVTMNLVMTGADTRKVTKSGYYDIVLSDVNQVDANAFVVIHGQVYRTALVSSAAEEINI
jgi:hypothetical protein